MAYTTNVFIWWPWVDLDHFYDRVRFVSEYFCMGESLYSIECSCISKFVLIQHILSTQRDMTNGPLVNDIKYYTIRPNFENEQCFFFFFFVFYFVLFFCEITILQCDIRCVLWFTYWKEESNGPGPSGIRPGPQQWHARGLSLC